jgi:hypothetical protein
MTDAQTWYNSSEYQKILPLRVNNAVRAAIRVSNRGGPRCAIDRGAVSYNGSSENHANPAYRLTQIFPNRPALFQVNDV